MLHTKFRGNRSAGSGEKIFTVFFLSLKLTRTVRNHFVGQSAIHCRMFNCLKLRSRIPRFKTSYVIRNTFVIVTESTFVGNLNSF